MLPIIANILYVLIALAMTVLILLQRGAGADAGSGFGGGASATVFGARGSANFLSRSTAVLAGLFFLLSLGMGMFLSRPAVNVGSDDLGVMSGAQVPAPVQAPKTIQIGDVPQPGASEPAATGDKPAPQPAASAEPAAPAAGQPPQAKPAGEKPKEGGKDGK